MKILVLNCGSSSVKFQFLEMDTEDVLARGLVEKIGSTGALLRYKHGEAQEIREVTEVPNHEAAINLVLSTLMHPRDGVIGSVDEIDGDHVGSRATRGEPREQRRDHQGSQRDGDRGRGRAPHR